MLFVSDMAGDHHYYLMLCVCDKQFSDEHAFGCPCGGLPTIRHNELRDITAELLTEICHNVGIEPPLQTLSGESFKYKQLMLKMVHILILLLTASGNVDKRLILM